MATDGTKIVDGDLAHDIYGEFMDLYDSGANVDLIKTKIEKWRTEIFDDHEKEVFITTYALALWETGNLTEEILNETKETVNKGAGVKMWLEESGEKDSLLRKKELENFLVKISAPKEKVRARKKYTKIKNFIFEMDDVLAFMGNDNFYYACILKEIFQHKGNCMYYLTPTTYKDLLKPSVKELEKCSVVGKMMPASGSYNFDESMKVLQEQGSDAHEKWLTKNSKSFYITLDALTVEHKDFIKFADKFECIGKLPIDN